ncbi:hypothetical protein J4218_01640 [Candidatus Pacearchaeota archaeon]|nr:hypothetical protein [uncultured archaeon]MBS3078801.1 hypothetical protein [Candidatus Pacearchaeota archaeon]
MVIRLVALDIYGTVLATDDHNSSFPPRRGLECFFDVCDVRGIKVVTSSDCYTANVMAELAHCFGKYPDRRMSLQRFAGFFQLDEVPVKDFSRIIAKSQGIVGSLILPSELLVIGDSDKDIDGALKHGCCSVRCP